MRKKIEMLLKADKTCIILHKTVDSSQKTHDLQFSQRFIYELLSF